MERSNQQKRCRPWRISKRSTSNTLSYTTSRARTVRQVAEFLRVSSVLVYRLVATGALPCARLSNAIRIAPDELTAFLKLSGRPHDPSKDSGQDQRVGVHKRPSVYDAEEILGPERLLLKTVPTAALSLRNLYGGLELWCEQSCGLADARHRVLQEPPETARVIRRRVRTEHGVDRQVLLAVLPDGPEKSPARLGIGRRKQLYEQRLRGFRA